MSTDDLDELGPIDIVVIGFPADAPMTGEAMEPGESAVVIMFENRWAAPFAAAVRRNGGQLIATQRIPTQELIRALESLEA